MCAGSLAAPAPKLRAPAVTTIAVAAARPYSTAPGVKASVVRLGLGKAQGRLVWLAHVGGPTFSSPTPGRLGTPYFAGVRVEIDDRTGRVVDVELEQPTGDRLVDVPLCTAGEVSTAARLCATG
jgi:hypothetical protein